MTLLLWTVFTTSLLGSVHCAAMCGPLVTFYAGSERGPSTHLAYNGGRLLAYAALGAIAGGIGAAVDLAGDAAQVQGVAALLAGGFIVVWGGLALLRALGVRIPWARTDAAPPERLIKLRRKPPVARAGLLGLLSAALPCGWLYAFVAAAAGTGSALAGAAVMATFWLGTVPMLLGLGVAARRIARLLGHRLPAVTAALLIVVGLAAIFTRAPMIGQAHAASAAASDDPTAAIEEPSCHGD
jgi:sulfite exporter TauE/SafE